MIERLPTFTNGAIAQLGERVVRNDEAVGSIPTSSTKSPNLFDGSCVRTGIARVWYAYGLRFLFVGVEGSIPREAPCETFAHCVGIYCRSRGCSFCCSRKSCACRK